MKSEWFKNCFDASYVALDRLRYPLSLNEAQATGIARLLGMQRGRRWLDVCCGYGRHLLPLIAQGYDVTGIDLSRAMLQALENDARRQGLIARAIRTDMREIPFASHFHGAYLVGSSFGVFDEPEDDLRSLRSIYRSLKPDCRLLIDQANPQVAFPASTPSRNTYQFQSQQVVEEVTRDEAAERVVIQRTLRRGSWTKQWTMSFRIYDAVSLPQVLEEAGFARAEIYGDLDGRPYHPASPRLALVASRGPST